MSTTTAVTNGTKVRIVAAYPHYSESSQRALVGATGTCVGGPDSERDIRVTLDAAVDGFGVGSYVYARAWEVLDGAEQDPSLAGRSETEQIAVEATPTEGQLADLLDAVYETAKSRGWGHLLPDLMDRVGLPLRPAERTLRITLLRVADVPTDERERQRERLAQAVNTDLAGTSKVMLLDTMQRLVLDVAWPQEQDIPGCTCTTDNRQIQESRGNSLPGSVQTQIAGLLGMRGSDTYAVRSLLHQASTTYHTSCKFCV